MIEIVEISRVKTNPNNPRTIKDAKFKKLVQSIREFPEMLDLRPIVVNSDFMVLGGNMRLKACKEAGLKEIPVINAQHLTEEQQKEFIVKDNLGYGEWDMDSLLQMYDSEKLDAWGMDLPELEDEKIEAEEDDYEMPDEVLTDIQLGDMFQIGPHRLLCGDATDPEQVGKLMGGELADMVMTDPPYNVDYQGGTGLKIMNDKMDNSSFYRFLFDFHTAFAGATKPGGAWYVWHADSEGLNFRKAFIDSGLLLKQCLIWVKNAMVMGRQDYQWKHEPCLYGWKAGASHYFIDERNRTTVIEDSIDVRKMSKDEMQKMLTEILSDKNSTTVIHCDKPSKNDVHPTMKPIMLLAPLINNSSKIGGLVIDGFLGSGSTMVASHQLKRKCYGTELDPKYCQVILDRMRKLDPDLQIVKL